MNAAGKSNVGGSKLEGIGTTCLPGGHKHPAAYRRDLPTGTPKLQFWLVLAPFVSFHVGGEATSQESVNLPLDDAAPRCLMPPPTSYTV